VTTIAADPDHAEISAAERWELIERVLGSQEFKRAQRLRELLQYIGTQAVKSGATSIHEQEIGRAVFGRSGDYDTSLDNIVRVNVTELRKRLGHYFEGEGVNEAVLVGIPRGAYIPVFCRRPLENGDEMPGNQSLLDADFALPLAASGIEPEESQATPMGLRKWKSFGKGFWAAAGCAVLLGCCVCVLLWQNRALRAEIHPWQSDPVRQALWVEFLGSNEEVDIVTADTSLALVEDLLIQPV
jgi:hypothetical protein